MKLALAFFIGTTIGLAVANSFASDGRAGVIKDYIWYSAFAAFSFACAVAFHWQQ